MDTREDTILITQRQLSINNFLLYVFGFLNMLYMYSYLSMTSKEKNYGMSYLFLIYIFGSVTNFYVEYKKYKRDRAVLEIPISASLYSRLLILNYRPFIYYRIIAKLTTITIGLIFAVKYYNDCDPYSDHGLQCTSIDILSTNSVLECILYLMLVMCICKSRHMSHTEVERHPSAIDTFLQSHTIQIANPSTEDMTCSICLVDSEGPIEWTTLNCNHKFHKECISQWLHINSICPICRQEINENIQTIRQESNIV